MYRLRTASEFLDTASFDFTHNQWAQCVQQAQLAVENAAKAVLACFGPIPRTHTPQDELKGILQYAQQSLSTEVADAIQVIIVSCQHLGWREHILASYGDEEHRLTPSQLFNRSQAANALESAKHALENTQTVIHTFADSGLSETDTADEAG